MKASEEITSHICDAIPEVTPELLEIVLKVAGQDSQLLFIQGEGQQVIDGKSSYPNYLQVQVTDVREAMNLAQQLMSACSAAIDNGGVFRSPLTLSFAGQALLSE